MGATRSEFRTPLAAIFERRPTQSCLSPPGITVTPHFRLQDALGNRRPGVRFVRPVHHRYGVGFRQRGEVDRFENLRVEFLRFGGIEGQAEQDEHIREALDAEADGAVPHVRTPRGLHWVVVHVDDPVQVARYLARDLGELGVVKVPLLGAQGAAELLGLRLTGGGRGVGFDDEPGERDGREVAHRGFLRGRELDDLRAQVRRPNRTQVLLVGFAVARVFEQHVGVAGFYLRFENRKPKELRLDGLLAFARFFVRRVLLFERLTPAIREPGALVRAHQRPFAV